jgi:hypothetical protein
LLKHYIWQTEPKFPNPFNVGTIVDQSEVELIDENGGGPGVRLRKRKQKKG